MKRIHKGDERNGWYSVEPADAQKLLDEQPENRPLRDSKAERFAADIKSNRWLQNGEPIILDDDAKLLDGQGRCRAIVIAGKAIESYVVFGIPRKFFVSVDTGQNRSGADTLALGGTANYAIAAAVCRLAIRAGLPSGSSSTIPNWKLNDFARKNKDRLVNAFDVLGPVLHQSPLIPSILLYVYMEAHEINPTKARDFALGVAVGEGLPAGSPMLVLRNRMIALRGDAHKMLGYEKLALTIKAWNAFVAGKKISLLKWTSVKSLKKGSGRGEVFPSISDGSE